MGVASSMRLGMRHGVESEVRHVVSISQLTLPRRRVSLSMLLQELGK
jgi:hypothetical protein